jgi:hypothetical protein
MYENFLRSSLFPIVDRGNFEKKIMDNETWASEGQSWRALCYAIHAIGCRLTIGDEGMDGFRLQNDARDLFSKSLALLPEILITQKSIVTVQALTAMVRVFHLFRGKLLTHKRHSSCMKAETHFCRTCFRAWRLVLPLRMECTEDQKMIGILVLRRKTKEYTFSGLSIIWIDLSA